MKAIYLLTVLMLISFQSMYAQTDAYTKAMEDNIASLQKPDLSNEDYQKAANMFERIGNTQAKEWLPQYWTSYCYVMISLFSKEKESKDLYADKANDFYQKIVDLKIENDETCILKAYIAQAKLSADPGSRWMNEGMAFKQYVAKAKELNPENPRVYLMEGSNIFYTPENFGGGKAKALPILQESEKKYNAFKPASSIHPNWGRSYLQSLLEKCNTTTSEK